MYHAIVFLPLLGALLAGYFSLSQKHGASATVAIGGVVGSLLLSIFAFFEVAVGGNPTTIEIAR